MFKTSVDSLSQVLNNKFYTMPYNIETRYYLRGIVSGAFWLDAINAKEFCKLCDEIMEVTKDWQ